MQAKRLTGIITYRCGHCISFFIDDEVHVRAMVFVVVSEYWKHAGIIGVLRVWRPTCVPNSAWREQFGSGLRLKRIFLWGLARCRLSILLRVNSSIRLLLLSRSVLTDGAPDGKSER